MNDTITAAEFRNMISKKKFPGQKRYYVVMKPRKRTFHLTVDEFGSESPYPGKEDQLQRETVKRLRLLPCRPIVIHVPNGGSRRKVEAAILKGMGVTAGVPDLLVFEARNGYNGMAIEMKARGGSVKPEQAEMMSRFAEKRWYVCVCWSHEGVTEAIEAYFGNEI